MVCWIIIRDDGFKIDAEVFNVIQGEYYIISKTTGIGLIEISTIFSNLNLISLFQLQIDLRQWPAIAPLT